MLLKDMGHTGPHHRCCCVPTAAGGAKVPAHVLSNKPPARFLETARMTEQRPLVWMCPAGTSTKQVPVATPNTYRLHSLRGPDRIWPYFQLSCTHKRQMDRMNAVVGTCMSNGTANPCKRQ